MHKAYRFILLCTLILFVSSSVSSQQNPPSPTPAPSKTATPTATGEVEVTAAPSESNSASRFEPFTQSDLSVLTGNVQRPNGAVWFNEQLYVVCNGDWTLYQLDSTTGSTETYIYGIRNGHVLYAEDAGEGQLNLWIPDFETNSLMLVNRTRAPQTIVSNLQGPWGIAYLDSQTFLVTNMAGNNVMSISREGEASVVASELRAPAGIVIDGDYVFVANNGSSRRSIEWFDKVGLVTGEDAAPRPLVSGLQNTTGMALGADGYLYFTYALGTRGVVGRIQPEACLDGGCTNDQVEIVIYTELAAPLAGLTISPDMRLFMHTIFRPEIYWVQLS